MFLVASGDGRRQHEEESAARREDRQDHAPRSAFPVDEREDSRPRRGHPGAGLGRSGDLRVREEGGPVMKRGGGRIFKRKGSRFWWASFYVRGKEVRQSTDRVIYLKIIRAGCQRPGVRVSVIVDE